MKRKALYLLLPVVGGVCLASCSSFDHHVHHEIREYIAASIDYKDDFRILQLTDIHLGDKDNTQVHYDFMDLTINEAHPDLIVITGDVFTFASKQTALEFFDYIDKHNIKWTITWGNHDEQCYFSIDWMTDVLNNYGSNCLFKDIQDDDIQGNANFAINLMKGEEIFEQLIIMDSNRYYFGFSDGFYMGYDFFKPNQIQWYSDLVDYTKTQNGGNLVDSLMFYHIPLPEVRDAWEEATKNPSANLNNGELGEEPCNPDHNSGFFDVIVEKGSTKGMYFGHDHINNFLVKYQGVDFGYGIKATDRVYYTDAMLGGRVITIKNNHELQYQDIAHTYAEVM